MGEVGVMSKERELLQRLVDSGVLGGYSFIAEVKELLAQPEHIPDVGNMVTQEPVAWCQMVEGKVEKLSDETV